MREHPEFTVPERRRFGIADEERAEALRRFHARDSQAEIARWLGLSQTQVRYLLMQERVEAGEIQRVARTAKAIREALEQSGQFNTAAWVACRAGVAQAWVEEIRDGSR